MISQQIADVDQSCVQAQLATISDHREAVFEIQTSGEAEGREGERGGGAGWNCPCNFKLHLSVCRYITHFRCNLCKKM